MYVLKLRHEYHMKTKRMFKEFGIEGQEIQVMFHDAPNAIFNGFYIQARVIKEYKKYILIEILPHHNPNRPWGISESYRMCINKTDIWIGNTVILVNGKRLMQ